MERMIFAVLIVIIGVVVGLVLKATYHDARRFTVPVVISAILAVVLIGTACYTSVPTGHTGVVTTFWRV